MNTIIANAKKINQISFISSPLVNTITCSLQLIVVTILLRNNDGDTSSHSDIHVDCPRPVPTLQSNTNNHDVASNSSPKRHL